MRQIEADVLANPLCADRMQGRTSLLAPPFVGGLQGSKPTIKVDLNIALNSPFKKRYENYIGGEWRPPHSGKYFDNISPITRPTR